MEGRGEILFQLGVPSIKFPESMNEDEKHRLYLDYLHRLRDHLKANGWDFADYAFYPVDEPGLDDGKRVPGLVEAAELFREADPGFRVYTDPVHGLSLADFERIKPLIDVWCPEMELVTGLVVGDPRMEGIKESGKTIWSYECLSQVKSLSPLRYNRPNAWRAHFFGLEGIGFWTYTQTHLDHWFQGEGFEEYALVYPGEFPVPSVRWEAVRDGLEDMAAMSFLEDLIAEHRESGTEPLLVEEAEKAIRLALTDVMELSDEAFIQSRDFCRQGDRRTWHTETDVRMYQHHREEISRLTLALSRN
jgi:hypothetical protein